MVNETKYDEIVNECKELSVKLLKKFIRKLDLEPSAFEHIYQIPIFVQRIIDGPGAQYISNEFKIIVNSDYLDDVLSLKIEEDNIKYNISLTLIHEMLHANRALMIEGGLSNFTLETKLNNELINYDNEINGHNLDQYASLLSKIMEKEYVSKFKKYIPIKVTPNNDGTLTVIAYNIQSSNYEIFKKINISFDLNTDIDDFIQKIGHLLNSLDAMSIESNKVYTLEDRIDYNSVIASDYYHQFTGRFVANDEIKPNLTASEYGKLLDQKVEILGYQFENQESFEEAITEALANIIILTRDDAEINLSKTVAKLQSKESDDDVKIAAKIIDKMGIDMIKWFMTSAYDFVYDDKMAKTFGEKYDDLLYDVSDIYEAIQYGDQPEQISIDDAHKIIDEKLGKRK